MSKNYVRLPDGSGFGIAEVDLPETHWLYERDDNAFGVQAPPMMLRCGTNHGVTRLQLAAAAVEAARYAIRVTTHNGLNNSFDPDAMVRNFVTGLIGYSKVDGLGGEPGDDPDAVPNQVVKIIWEK